MRSLIRMNLMAHRQRNKLTSLIYSLTLGSIIFLLVSATLQLKLLQSAGVLQGSDLTLLGGSPNDLSNMWLFAKDADPILIKHKDSIKDFAYITSGAN